MHGVTGPNEYDNNVNNNWYTNYIATWCMRYAATALSYVKDLPLSKDLAQEIFLSLWKRQEEIQINYSVKAYLRGAIINACKSELRKRRTTMEITTEALSILSTNDVQKSMEYDELNQRIDAVIAAMPERCRIIFLLSRKGNLSHKEIAKALNISTKTIENQMTKALKMLRKELKAQNLISFILIIFS